jgi:hypothetical protein
MGAEVELDGDEVIGIDGGEFDEVEIGFECWVIGRRSVNGLKVSESLKSVRRKLHKLQRVFW